MELFFAIYDSLTNKMLRFEPVEAERKGAVMTFEYEIQANKYVLHQLKGDFERYRIKTVTLNDKGGVKTIR